jgi:CRISPR/Cas system CSM-associated protein Csm3 (group 7 of RAMP superfamily)
VILVLSNFKAKFLGILEFMNIGPLNICSRRLGNILYTLKVDKYVVIPSTTWKGAFRQLSERLVENLPMEKIEKLAVRTVTLAKSIREKRERVKHLLEDFKSALKGDETKIFDHINVKQVLLEVGYSEEELQMLEDPINALIQYLEYYCPVGRLFGNSVRAGSIRFLDTLIQAETMLKPGIGINREKLTVEEGALYLIESIPIGTSIKLVMIGELEDRANTPSKLLASILEAVKEIGLNIGGRKSVGSGLLKLKTGSFYIIEYAEDARNYGIYLANPFKRSPISLDAFIKWLRGE